MVDDACHLDPAQRRVVESTIQEHCTIRGWTLRAVNCRSNHVHVVVAAQRDPREMREQFKAWCTRQLKELEQARRRDPELSTPASKMRKKWWAERGSGRFVNDEDALERVIHYVREEQDQRVEAG